MEFLAVLGAFLIKGSAKHPSLMSGTPVVQSYFGDRDRGVKSAKIRGGLKILNFQAPEIDPFLQRFYKSPSRKRKRHININFTIHPEIFTNGFPSRFLFWRGFFFVIVTGIRCGVDIAQKPNKSGQILDQRWKIFFGILTKLIPRRIFFCIAKILVLMVVHWWGSG